MTLVIDASVAAKLLFTEPETPEARQVVASGRPIIAPDLIVAEVISIAWKKHRVGQIAQPLALAAPSQLPNVVDRFEAMMPLAARAVEIAFELQHPPYDCFYLALAETVGCSFVTADKRFLSAVSASVWAPIVQPLVP